MHLVPVVHVSVFVVMWQLCTVVGMLAVTGDWRKRDAIDSIILSPVGGQVEQSLLRTVLSSSSFP